MVSNTELQDTKVSWKLSADKKHYTFEFNSNTTYTTTVVDVNGNVIEVLIEVTGIKDIAVVKVEYQYQEATNTVLATMVSNKELQDTKVSWKLSEDKKQYTFEFNNNTTYTTTVTDIDGNIIEVLIEVKDIKEIKVEVSYEFKPATNTVIATMTSNTKLQDTKVSWKLSEDKKSYSFEFDSNTNYITTVTDILGNVIPVEIKITQIVEVSYEYKEATNTVIATIKSNTELLPTKVSWKLSEDKKSYTFEFDSNTSYKTTVTDIHGNVITIQIKVTQVKDLGNGNYVTIEEQKYPGYKALLKQLQKQHPNWIFTIKYTGLDWNTVIGEEDKIIGASPRSLTQYTKEWKNGDTQYGTGWYRASKKAIAYMMDPRNSLDEEYIFQFQDLTSTAGTYADVEKMIAGSFLTKYKAPSSTANIINTILSSARTHHISPYHIVSRMLQEQGFNGSILNGYKCNDKGEKEETGRTVYNLFNIGATGNSDEEIIKNGAKYAYDHHWFTPEACIEGSVSFLNNGYFSKGQTTLYFQKYNVVNKNNLYGNQYMQNIRAANDEGKRISDSYRKNGFLNSQFEFVIPAYENMPTSPSPRPAQ